jgi:hypothetical protein
VRTSSAIIGPIAGPRMDGKHDHALSTPAMVRGLYLASLAALTLATLLIRTALWLAT